MHSLLPDGDYCNSLSYGVAEDQIRKLQRVINTSARIVYCAPKYCHINPLLRRLHQLPVKLRIDFKILLITSKILQSLVPNYRENLISILPVSHYQFRRNNNGTLLESPRFITEKTMGDRSFTVVAPVLWKGHPLPIRQTKSVDSFKRLLETYSFT